ncbi:hypothetical protein Gpo141_00003717 [Globisporangium polare]
MGTSRFMTALCVLVGLFLSTAIDAQTLVKSNDGTGLHVYFRTGWTSPYIHYSQGSSWTTAPGVAMTKSSDYVQFPPEEGWFRFALAAPAATLEFVFNNGNGVWDNNGNKNYKATAAGTYSVVTTVSTPPTRGSCWTWEGLDQCQSSSQAAFPDSDEARRWQTPPRNAATWSTEYQDYRSLTGYAHVVYAADRLSATVTARTFLRANATCTYTFNSVTQSSPQFTATSALKVDLLIKVECTATSNGEKWTLGLDPVNFVWQANAVNQPAGMEGGQRGAVVDFFGWPYADIEAECKDFLGKAGYMGVKIPPPQESLFSNQWTFEDQRNPWYITYQPVSYRLYSRLGSRSELRSMVQTCRANGVRVYADAVVNHMASGGNDVYSAHRKDNGNNQCAKWSSKSSTKGSPYFTHSYAYVGNAFTGQRPAMEYPAVPFGPTDFHCERTTGDAKDPFFLENEWLLGLSDLNTKKQYVRERIAQYFVDLLGVGISGLRVDAIKHIGPTDAAAIFGLLNKYMGGSFPADFVSWGEVVISDDANVVACDASSSYNFYTGLDAKFLAEGISQADVSKLKLWSWDYPNNFPLCGSWILPPSRFVIQNDDHDQQPADSVTRPMGDKGSVLVRDKDVTKHREFEKLLFTRTDADWKIKVVLSSYTFFADGANGFPDGFSDCAGFDTSLGNKCLKGVPYEKAFRAGSCGYTVENFAGGKYTRVHRDLGIVNAMRAWIGNLTQVTAADVGITGTC